MHNMLWGKKKRKKRKLQNEAQPSIGKSFQEEEILEK